MTEPQAGEDSAASEHLRRINQYLSGSSLVAPDHRVVPLTGDASTRRYFRVIPAAGPNAGPSIVLALHDEPIEFSTLPFVNVADLLRQMPLPVPAVIGYSDALGILALQDLGDVTLQAHVGAARATEHAALYRQAVAFIASLQQRGAELASDAYTPYGIVFDVEKLMWELDFFVRHFVEGYRGATLTAGERTALAEEWSAIAEELAAEPRVVCHRDYHSRNLMVYEGGLFIIDFQDARMGPDTYDLASLLRDSYVDISEGELDDLIAYFLAVAGKPDAEAFRRRFDLTAVQRNLKALGTFGYQASVRHNSVYIQYMPRTLHYARANLEKYPRFARLRALLASHLEEFQ
jgi:aminoglycoside/choline kinase family phosphotransferase